MKRLWISFTIFIFLAGCTTTLAVDLKQVYAKISEEKQLPKLIEVDKEAVEQIYEFDMEQVKQFAIYRPLTNVQVDEIILVEAQQNKVLELKEKIDDYLTMSEDYWREFLPSQYDLLIHRKELLINDYYCVVIGEKANEVIEALENALKA